MSITGETEEGVIADRYALHGIIGRGGVADVYRGSDRLLHRDVAVKVLRDGANEDSARERFTAEARLLARLSHPGLVMLLDAGIDSERPYLVMEFVDGQTMEAALTGMPVELSRVRRIGHQLAEALAYAHDRGVVHRDVKPGNVLLGSDGRARLADFGIARLIGDTVRHTRMGQAIGTAAYLAPEQVTGEAVDGSADVYSLGLLLLEALTGARAYPGASVEAALARLTRQPSIPEHLSPPWRGLLASMTALDSSHRPTAAEVAARLRERSTALQPLDGSLSPEVATLRLETPGLQPDPAASTRVLEPWTREDFGVTGATNRERVKASPTSSFGNRAGEALEYVARAGMHRLRRLPDHQLGVLAAVAALVLLIVIVAVATNDDPKIDQDLPADIPPGLEQPLADLHEAVNGG